MHNRFNFSSCHLSFKMFFKNFMSIKLLLPVYLHMQQRIPLPYVLSYTKDMVIINHLSFIRLLVRSLWWWCTLRGSTGSLRPSLGLRRLHKWILMTWNENKIIKCFWLKVILWKLFYFYGQWCYASWVLSSFNNVNNVILAWTHDCWEASSTV